VLGGARVGPSLVGAGRVGSAAFGIEGGSSLGEREGLVDEVGLHVRLQRVGLGVGAREGLGVGATGVTRK
jgi:hypothetical protein